MSTKPKILCLGSREHGVDSLRERLGDVFEIDVVRSPVRALSKLMRNQFEGIYVASDHVREVLSVGRLLQNERILQGMPDGVALIDSDNTIIWANSRLRQWSGCESPVGKQFYEFLGISDILGPDYGPFMTALSTKAAATSTIRCETNKYYRIHAVPVFENEAEPRNLIVTVQDVTTEMLQQQKLQAIHKAGTELASLTADELCSMTVPERIELLKSKILQHTQDLLHFDVVEIRSLDEKTGRLEPLLAVGMTPEAVGRELQPALVGNGVTGYVASLGISYLCSDTTKDPLYIEGCSGAKSSLTVPLILNEQVIGTFNVESPKQDAFTEGDQQFLEIYSRDVARALNTFQLLSVEKVATAAESIEKIHRAVALPVDEILNEAVNIMGRYIGHDSEVVDSLKRILLNARNIKQTIHEIGQQLVPVEALPQILAPEERPALRNRKVLVVDPDKQTLDDAHHILDRHGCTVETAHDGHECLNMIRGLSEGAYYDVIIAAFVLPDMSGYELFCRLRPVLDTVPMVLMNGFGYDAGHTMVKARTAGLRHFLYKPFRVDQLLDTVEEVAGTSVGRPLGAGS